MNKENRYKFIVNGNTVICLSHYAGKVVKGVAKCGPDDAFDVEFGKKLAQARCDHKIAVKRIKRATGEMGFTAYMADVWASYFESAEEYFDDASAKLEAAEEALNALEAEAACGAVEK